MPRGRPKGSTNSNTSTEPKEDKDTKTAAVQMPTALWEAADEKAREQGLTLTSFIKRELAPIVNFQGDIGDLTKRYANEEDRKSDLKRQSDEKAKIVKATKAAMASKDKAAGVKALLESLSIKLTPEQLASLAGE